MFELRLHPAMWLLLRFQRHAAISHLWKRLASPRRIVMTLMAGVLALFWIGQATLGILFRDTADPVLLQRWIPLGLLAYATWHLLRTACRTPVEPFEWTPAERELLGGAPLRRCELVMYRLAGITGSAAAKAACFAAVMLPDLPIWPAGFAGMFLALLLLDLWRMALEVVAYGLSPSAFLKFRLAVLLLAAGCVASALVSASCSPAASSPSLTGLDFVVEFVTAVVGLQNTWVGWAAVIPFRVFAQLMLATQLPAVGMWLCLGSGMVLAMTGLLLRLDSWLLQTRVHRQRREFARACAAQSQAVTAANDLPARGTDAVMLSVKVNRPWRLGGVGSLAWRQLHGARHYATSVLMAVIVPAFLSLLPLLTPLGRLAALMHVVAGLVFYTFLLLPAGFKFDFRRDVDRMAVMKALPLTPLTVTLGQLAVPVLLSSAFQASVLLVAMLWQPFSPGWLLVAAALLLPVNVLIYALENLIFLLYPYRLNQEGIDVFLRSILTFTAKGILFAVALAVTLAWALAAKSLARTLWPGSAAIISGVIFAGGMWFLTTGLAMALVHLLARAYRKFDPSQDTPALC